MAGVEPIGLRERKKRRTRREISDVATQLFVEHGFEQVTLAQIAEAAEVSVKTIFNHFGSKEDLYFDRAQELREAVVGAIATRPPGTTILEALRRLLADNRAPFPDTGWEVLADPEGYAELAAFLRTQERSPALRARALTHGDELAAQLHPLLVVETGRDPGDPAVQALVAMVIAAFGLRSHALSATMAEQAPAAEVEARVRAVVDEAFSRLAAAFADLDRVRA